MMRKSAKTAFTAVLATAVAAAPFHTVFASEAFCKAPKASAAFALHSIGPGLNNLSPEDENAEFQWAFQNDGNLNETERRINFESIDDLYVHYGKNGIDAISIPPLGPNNFNAVSTVAVAGIDINIREAWDIYSQTENKRPVTVALIDTGVDFTHKDLTSCMWVNADEIPDDGIDNDGNGYIDDVNGWNFLEGNNQIYTGREDVHGTHAAGTIAASKGDGGVVGIADGSYVKIMSLKALGGSEGMGSADSVIEAIRYAEANGAQICNLSFGSREVPEEFISVVRDSPMLFIVSAGNGDKYEIGFDIDKYPVYPASLTFDNVISVANLSFNGKLDDSSNYGPYNVDIAAPGSLILSTIPGNSYAFMTGTSMSAPMVTGAAAMLYSARPELSLQDVKNILMASSHKLAFLKGKVLSSGMLDVTAAMKWGKQ